MKHLKLILSILFIFCLTRTYADDSNYLFRHYQVENGLSDNMATCCVQDRKGYIWIGTRDGLNRFDGYTFKVFRNDPDETETLGSNWITCLGCDMNGDLWVGTLSGLYQYDDEKESFRHIPFTADKGIDIFQFDKDNKLWILMDGSGSIRRTASSVSSLRKTTKATPLFALPAKTVSGSGVRTG